MKREDSMEGKKPRVSKRTEVHQETVEGMGVWEERKQVPERDGETVWKETKEGTAGNEQMV